MRDQARVPSVAGAASSLFRKTEQFFSLFLFRIQPGRAGNGVPSQQARRAAVLLGQLRTTVYPTSPCPESVALFAARMAFAARKRARTGEGGEEDEEPVPVADGFEAPIFGVRIVGEVTTLALEGEDGPLSLGEVGIASDHAGAWYVATEDSLLHVSAAGRVRRVAALPASKVNSIATTPNESAATGVSRLWPTTAAMRSGGC